MGSMSKMICPKCVLLDLEVADKTQLIRSLVDSLASSGQLSDPDLLFRDIMAREQLASTGLGQGCAVPHAHSLALDKTLVVAARLARPIDFGSTDGQPVSLVFLMAGPKDSAGLHLKLLSKIARFLHDAQFRQQLAKAESAELFYRLICDRDG